MSPVLDLGQYGISVKRVHRNLVPAALYEQAVKFDQGTLVASGALAARSGEKTGRSPKDKRIVEHPEYYDDVWEGNVNFPLSPASFQANRQRAIDYLNLHDEIYVVDGFAGWDPKYRLKVRVICVRPYHAMFMHNMLIRPSDEDLASFGQPDCTIFNAGQFPANPHTHGVDSSTSVSLSFKEHEMVILGTQYAGEMKKGIFTVMHYLMPERGVLSMHCSANEGDDGDVSLFFGLSEQARQRFRPTRGES